MDPFAPRMVVPFSDGEIIDLYQQAMAARLAESRAAEKDSNDQVVDDEHWGFIYFLADFAILAALTLFTTFTFARYSPAMAVIAAIICCAVPILFFLLTIVVSNPSRKFAIGPVGYFMQRQPARTEPPLVKIDPSSPAVLSIVIDYISETPINRSKALKSAIEGNRAQLKRTLSELPQLVDSFEREIRVAESDDLLLILQSRRDAAKEALSRLRKVDENLESQYKEAELAVQPLVKMRSQFERYRQLSQSLSRIQAAHDLAVTGEDQVRDNRLELRALYASSVTAQARLAEIQSLMDATELAREEVRQLMA
jgi:hypothetical protein